MTQEQRQRANRFFLEAQSHPPEARSRFLDEACAGDEALRGLVESLLAHDAAASRDGFLGAPCPLNVKEQAAGKSTFVGPAGEPSTHTGPATEHAPTKPPEIPGYAILAELGRGGMGVVYQARQAKLKRVVAVKMMLAGAGAEDQARFRIEAEAAARLQHPNIVQIHEVGEHDGQPFCALEFVEGGSLAQRQGGKPIAPGAAARLVATLARAMQYAHERGIVHRDLKPGNVLLASPAGTELGECVPKIADFGLAKRLDDDSGQTRTGMMLGTPSYMAPEQTTGRPQDVGPLADVYALGAILYELLTGRPPFRNANVLDTIMQVRMAEPVPPRCFDPRLPRDLETICLKCLHKEPQRRYDSARALAEDLERFLNHEPIQARSVRTLERVLFKLRRRPATALAVVTALALVAASAGGVWLWYQLSDTRQREAERIQAEAQASAVTIEYFANVAQRWREFEGVGPVSEDEARHRSFTYRFRRRGGKLEQIDVLNGSFYPTTFHGIGAILDRTQNPVEKRECSYQIKRDANGKLLEEVATDRSGQVLYTFHYTSADTAHYKDAHGIPIARTASGAAYVRFAFDERGYQKGLWYLDRTGKRRPDQQGVYGMRVRHNERGLAVESTWIDADGKPIRSKDGIARVACAYDHLGNRTSASYFDPAGRPCLNSDGIARWTARYDAHGNQTESAFFGVDGLPCLDRYGVARWTTRYDDRGNRIEFAYADRDGRPAIHKDAGISRFTMQYDERGNWVEMCYYGTDERPALHKDGFARLTANYDERGNQTEMAHFGIDGRPALDSNGVARVAAGYDEHGRRTETAYFGADGRPVRHKDGYARWTTRHDEHGNRVETCHFGVDGKPAVDRNDVARFTQRYDDCGNCVETAYYGTDGKPCRHREGYAKVTFRYDEFGNRIESANFDTEDRPVVSRAGYARMTARFDEHGNQVEFAMFGTDDNPIATADGLARWTARYNERGNRTEIAAFGVDGKPVVLKGLGISKIGSRYDPHGNQIETEYFGAVGKPVLHRNGYARMTRTYDERGNLTAEAFFGIDGQPAPHKDGYARCTARYDDRGNRTETAYFDVSDKPALHKDGFAKLTWHYDDQYQPRDVTAFGVDGKPVRLQVSIQALEPGGTAERLRLQVGDVLVSYDGKEITSHVQFNHQCRQPGEPTALRKLTVLRAGRTLDFSVPPGPLGCTPADRARTH
jgi:serine/threonine protein kinase